MVAQYINSLTDLVYARLVAPPLHTDAEPLDAEADLQRLVDQFVPEPPREAWRVLLVIGIAAVAIGIGLLPRLGFPHARMEFQPVGFGLDERDGTGRTFALQVLVDDKGRFGGTAGAARLVRDGVALDEADSDADVRIVADEETSGGPAPDGQANPDERLVRLLVTDPAACATLGRVALQFEVRGPLGSRWQPLGYITGPTNRVQPPEPFVVPPPGPASAVQGPPTPLGYLHSVAVATGVCPYPAPGPLPGDGVPASTVAPR
jgi:hypothetical protein